MKLTPYTAEQIDSFARAIIARLTPEQVSYAVDAERGEYRGFAALHDLMDANMLLPSIGEFDERDEDDEYLDSVCTEHNRIMDRINELLLTPRVGDVVTFTPEWTNKGEEGSRHIVVKPEVIGFVIIRPEIFSGFAPHERVALEMITVVSRPVSK